jgi:hypothetical protein
MYTTALVLNGNTGNALCYSNLSKQDFNYLKNVRYLVGLKKSDNIVAQDNLMSVNNEKIKRYLIKQHKLFTLNGVSCLRVSDLPLKKSKLTMVNKFSYFSNGFNYIPLGKLVELAEEVLLKKDYSAILAS